MTEQRYVAFPYLSIERQGNAVIVENVAHGSRLKVSEDVLVLLEEFATPMTITALRERYDVPPDALDPLIERFLLVPVDERAILAGGLLAHSRTPSIGRRTYWWEAPARAIAAGWIVFGAPTDLAAAGSGARHGPRLVRELAPRVFVDDGANHRVNDLDLARSYEPPPVLDFGDIVHTRGESLDTFGARIRKVVRRITELDMRPAMIGGDHSVSWFVLDELLQRHDAMGIIHFDAHQDLVPSLDGVLTHANPFTFALAHPSMKLLIQVGVRTVDRVEPPFTERVDDARLRWVSAHRARSMTPEQIFASLPRDLPYYVTFDIDALDPAVAPETGTPVPGGLDFYQGFDLIDYVARTFQIIGVDIVEVAEGSVPSRVNMAATIAGRYLCHLLLGGTASSPLEPHHYRRPR